MAREELLTAEGQVAKINDRAHRSYRRQKFFAGVGIATGAISGLAVPELADRIANGESIAVSAGVLGGAVGAETVLIVAALRERSMARRRYQEVVYEFRDSLPVETTPSEPVRTPIRNHIFPAAPSAFGFQGGILETLAIDDRVPNSAFLVGAIPLVLSVATLRTDRRFDRNVRDARIAQIHQLEQIRQKNIPPTEA